MSKKLTGKIDVARLLKEASRRVAVPTGQVIGDKKRKQKRDAAKRQVKHKGNRDEG